MQKIIPYDLSIIIDKSKLVTSLSWIDENDTFVNPRHIKESLEDFFTKSSDWKSISLIKTWRKLVWMEDLIEFHEKDGRKFMYINLSVSTSKAKELWETKIVNEIWHILYKVNKWEVVLSNFYSYIEIRNIETQKDKYILSWDAFILSKWVETVRYELEQLLENVCYNKKAIVSIKDSLTPKDVQQFEKDIKEIQVLWQFKSNNDFVNLDSYSNEEVKKLKMWFFIKWQNNVIQTLKNKSLSKIFLEWKHETKATVKIWKSQRTADLNIENLTILMKSDIIDANDSISFLDFKNKCLKHCFWVWEPLKTIK